MIARKNKSMKFFQKKFDQDKFELLIDFNRAIGLVFLFQALLLLFFTNNTSIDITGSFLIRNPVTGATFNSIKDIFSIHIGTLVAGTMLIPAFTHFFISLPTVSKAYWNNVQAGIQPIRWIEYATSSSLMLTVLALILGITEYKTIILLSLVHGAVCFFGALAEKLRSTHGNRPSQYALLIGCWYELLTWITISSHIIGSRMIDSDSLGLDTIAVYGLLTMVFAIFPIHLLLNLSQKGPWKDYQFTERILIMTSLCAKSAFAWAIFILYLS
jgi:hypothetical protein